MEQIIRWAYTHCAGCYGNCSMRVKVVDGVIVKIEGVPESDFGPKGGLCAKGHATLLDFYDPNRCNYPVKRTNPKKGLLEDPKWQRITWDEAMDTIAAKLKEVKDRDPRRTLWAHTPMFGSGALAGVTAAGFFISYGSRNRANAGTGVHCGAVSHEGAGLFHASWSVVPDYRYCNYVIQFGSNKGTGSGHGAGIALRQSADGRARGMKTVVFDPMCNFSGGKATEWYPILPATDAAVVLSMCNHIVNGIGLYDREYIRNKTNGPYLVGADRKFVRDENDRPLLWDERDNRAKPYDDQTLGRPAIEGEYVAGGTPCRPAFHLIKEHLKQYTPEWAEEISSVPAQVIRRVATEFAQEARIGSDIEIEGIKLPYRPVSAIMYKGGQGHQNAFSQYFSVMLLNALVGNQEAVGGTVSWPARSLGYPETERPRFEPVPSKDGYMMAGMWYGLPPWPTHDPKPPQFVQLTDMFPHAHSSPYPYAEDFDEIWSRLDDPYPFEAMGIWGGNPVKSGCNPETAARILSRIPFIFSINTVHNETTEGFADIVLPDCHFLESCNAFASISYFFNFPMGLDDWAFHCRMPVVEPQYERRESLDMFLELAARVGFTRDFNNFLDNFATMKAAKWEVGAPSSVIIGPKEQLGSREISDRVLKYLFGENHGLEWFKEHGFLTWKKRPEETYWRWFLDVRVPIYLEFLEHDIEKVRPLAEQIGLTMDWRRYEGLLSYYPSVIHTEAGPDSEFDLFAISFKDVAHTGGFCAANPWIDEVSTGNPYTYNISMNMESAKARGLTEGDIVCLENMHGDQITGRLKVMKGMHPQVVAMVGALGSWAKGKPIAHDKGVNMNTLIRIDQSRVCPISLAPETVARVKAYKKQRGT